jgi:hypothetical protein
LQILAAPAFTGFSSESVKFLYTFNNPGGTSITDFSPETAKKHALEHQAQ